MPDYPKQILPHESYKDRMDVDKIAEAEKDACVVRRVNEKPVIKEVFGVKLLDNCDILKHRDILDMSTNLLGGKYQNAYLPFVDKTNRDWNGERLADIEDVLQDESLWTYIDIPFFPLMLRLSELHLHSFPYSRTFESQKLKKQFEEKYKIVDFYTKGDKGAEYSFTIRFHHSPTLLNYWHFEMKLYFSSDEVFPRKDAGRPWMKKILNDFVSKQFLHAMVDDEKYVAAIDVSYYLNGNPNVTA